MERMIDDSNLEDIRASQRSFIQIQSLLAFPELMQGFTIRFGGVSTGKFAALNLNFNRPDSRDNVLENYRLLSEALNVPINNMVLSFQVHDKKVMPVSREHAGMGLTRERSFRNVDGLVTQEKGLLLVTHYADCVPLYFYDPVKKAIGLSHSGWKGTLLNIGCETIKVLEEAYGCHPGDLHVAFGPHIKKCCFEVDTDVARQFQDIFPWAIKHSTKRNDGKWLLDLEGIITESLSLSGINKNNITGCRICTKCNRDIFFSHRGGNGNTGTGAAFMMIRG